MNQPVYSFFGCIYHFLIFSLSQGYERVRRNSDEEELYLMRTHDMEEGGALSDLSSSGEHQAEEVRPASSFPVVHHQ